MPKKMDLLDIQKLFEKEGYALLSKEYKSAHYHLKYVCPKGHKHQITYANWYMGKRCPYCARNAKLDIKDIEKSFIKEGYTLLSKEYKNINEKLKYRCSNGHENQILWNNWFLNNNRCPHCEGNARLTIDKIKPFFDKEGYIITDIEYKNNSTPLNCICNKGHKIKISWVNFQEGCRCGQCWHEEWFSKGEKEVFKYVKSIYNGTIIENDRTQIVNPKTKNHIELDIWMPKISKAIEYNGEYWHSNEDVKFKDNQKQIQCEQKGIDLLVINDIKWKKEKTSIKNKIYNFLGNNNET